MPITDKTVTMISRIYPIFSFFNAAINFSKYLLTFLKTISMYEGFNLPKIQIKKNQISRSEAYSYFIPNTLR